MATPPKLNDVQYIYPVPFMAILLKLPSMSTSQRVLVPRVYQILPLKICYDAQSLDLTIYFPNACKLR